MTEEAKNETPGAPDASSDGDTGTDGQPQGDALNPREKLRADALQLILDARRLGADPAQLIAEVLKSIED